MKITFIGGGNMASALIGGLVDQGFHTQDVNVVEVNVEAAEQLRGRYGVQVQGAAEGAALESGMIVLAVKPQQLREVSRHIARQLKSQILVSIAAGVRATDLSRWLGGYQRLVRAMPNTPAMARSGVTGLYALPTVSQLERDQTQRVMEAVGTVVWVKDEAEMDVITAVSGSGPAYVFYFMEALEEAAIALGLSAQQARQLSLATFTGAAKLAGESTEDVATLRARVTSKGGTTERAIHQMEAAALKGIVADAVRAAAHRSKELGDELGAPD
jgi:pyrroline-5-carboxylate reductase